MIWLIGNRGMLGTDVENLLRIQKMPFFVSDQEVDIADIRQMQDFTADKHISWIINCAAYTAVDKAEDEPEIAFKINAEGSQNIAKIAKTKSAKLIHISTDYVFDGTKEGAYSENDAPNPLGVYGASKYKGESNIIKISEQHFIIRSAWLYGMYGHNFVDTMLKLFKEKDELRVVNDQWGSPTYSLDLANVIIIFVKHKNILYGIYNFTNEEKTNWYEFSCAIFNLARKYNLIKSNASIIPINSEQYPQKAKRPKNSVLSKEKIKLATHISISDWRDALERFIASKAQECN